MKKLLYFSIILISLTSCESLIIKDLDIDDTGFEKQVVVQSFIEANTDSVVAFISENVSVLTSINNYTNINNADVRLLYEGSEIAKLEQRADLQYVYHFDEPLNGEGEYEIVVKDTPYKDARASTTLPEDRFIEDLEFKHDVGSDPLDMSRVSEISFVIDDPIGRDYYTLTIDSDPFEIDTFFQPDGDTLYDERYIYLYGASTQLDPSVSTDAYSDDFIINDETFDGQRKRIKLRVISNYYTSSDNFEERLRSILKLEFTTHSEESFKYITSLNAYDAATDFQLFSEPVSVFTNIENGLGVFAGKSKKTYRFE